MALYAFALLVGIVSETMQWDFLVRFQRRDDYSAREAAYNDDRQAIVAVFIIIALVASSAAFLKFLYRLSGNAHALAARPMKFSPAWTVGWYFVPLFNLFRPYQAMRELWNVSECSRNVVLLGLWWGLWILSNIIGIVHIRMMITDSIDGLVISSWLGIARYAVDFFLAIATSAVLASILRAQLALARRSRRAISAATL